jgi:dienelactone hydrolase
VIAPAVAAVALAGSWSGTYTLPASSQAVEIDVELQGAHAVVALGRGHAGQTRVVVHTTGTRLRFAFPGLPADVLFTGSARAGAIAGSVRQGPSVGAFRLHRGRKPWPALYGVYRSSTGAVVSVDQATGFPPWLVELPGGAVHGIGRALTVGTRVGSTSGDGTIASRAAALVWKRVRYERLAVRQREVRVGADAATLTIPPGRGPFPAVVMVHGSGPQTREEFQTFAAFCVSQGIAVLADDKRGVGQSGGSYPGEAATAQTLDVLARDAQAEVRFLARRPEIDRARVGLLGDSQAGWIIALAAAREPAVRWAVALVGPVATVGETDYWGALAGKSQSPPAGSDAALLKQVRAAGPSGFDPRPSLEQASIPIFWVFGDDDRNVPTQLSIERLQAIRDGHDFTWAVIHSTHALLELPSGLYSSLPQSRGFAPELFPAVGAWLRSHGLTR